MKIKNKTYQDHTFLLSRLYHIHLFFIKRIKKHFISNNRALITLFRIILVVYGCGCSGNAKLSFLSKAENQGQRKQTIRSMVMDLKNSILNSIEKENRKVLEKVIWEYIENKHINNLKKVNEPEVSNTCPICLDTDPKDNFYEVICCKKKVHLECLVHYIVYLASYAPPLIINKPKESVRPLCCKESIYLYQYVHRGVPKTISEKRIKKIKEAQEAKRIKEKRKREERKERKERKIEESARIKEIIASEQEERVKKQASSPKGQKMKKKIMAELEHVQGPIQDRCSICFDTGPVCGSYKSKCCGLEIHLDYLLDYLMSSNTILNSRKKCPVCRGDIFQSPKKTSTFKKTQKRLSNVPPLIVF